jgi:WD and tetratricopeptide repeat-containing protein 1
MHLFICSDNMSSVRYTANDVCDQLCLPPFHKEPATKKSRRNYFPAKATSRNSSRVSILVFVFVIMASSYHLPGLARHAETLCFSWHPFQVDMIKKLMQFAIRSLETGTNLMHGIEACCEILEAMESDIDDCLMYDCLCTRAGLYLKVCLHLFIVYQISVPC